MAPAAEVRFTRIYEAHYPAVLAYCARRVNRSEAEEVANEVFVTLWRSIESFEEESPLPWLYRVAHGAIRNRWKTAGRAAGLRSRLYGLAAESTDSTDDIVLRHEQYRAVLAALDSLRPGDREVLLRLGGACCTRSRIRGRLFGVGGRTAPASGEEAAGPSTLSAVSARCRLS